MSVSDDDDAFLGISIIDSKIKIKRNKIAL